SGSRRQLGKPGNRVDARGVLTGCDPVFQENTPYPDKSALESILFEQSPADDHFLDLGRTLTDQQHRGLPVEALDLVLLGEAVAAVDPEGVLHDLLAVLGEIGRAHV